MPDKDNFGAILQPTVIDRAAFNQGENAQYEPRIEAGETMSSLVAKGPHAVAQPLYYESHPQDSRVNGPKDVADTVSANYGMRGGNTPLVQQPMAIRRLTPKECERLQGFPDDWTKIPYRNKEADQCPDGPRYKACGNSMAVPVMRWIGERINLIESML
jgi:site-specific DNA-cytosine methylase